MPRHVIRRAVALAIAATALAGSAPALAQGFTLWVTETPAGGTTPFNSQFQGGVRSDTFNGLGCAPANIGTGPHQIATTASGALVVASLNGGGKLYPHIATPSMVSFASGTQHGTVDSAGLLYATAAGSQVPTFNQGSAPCAVQALLQRWFSASAVRPASRRCRPATTGHCPGAAGRAASAGPPPEAASATTGQPVRPCPGPTARPSG